MGSEPTPLRENLVRAMAPGMLTVTDGKTLFGHFARFNSWNEIDSAIEGRFLERLDPSAFTKTLTGRTPKILYNHGKDPQLGDKIIATPRSFGVDEIGPTLEGELLDGLDPLLVSGLRAGAYGMSYRFSIPSQEADVWVRNAPKSAHNPLGLPERTIHEVHVWEAGPVTWPADSGTDVAVRSLTDEFLRGGAPSTTPPVAPKEPTVSEYITREEKASRTTELKDVLSRMATEYPGVLPTEPQERWDAAVSELETLERDIAALDARLARVAQFGTEPKSPQSRESTYSAPTVTRTRTDADIYDLSTIERGAISTEDRDQRLRDSAMRSLETSTFPNPSVDQDKERERVAHLLDYADSRDKELARRMLQTGAPIYRRTFNKLVVGAHLTPEEDRAAAIAVVGTTTTGGYAVPYQFDPTIIHTGAYTNINPYRTICRVESIVGGNVWRGVSAGAVAAQYRAEGAAMTEGGPTLALPTYTAQRADAFVTLSREALQDRPDLGTELSQLIDEGKATNEEQQFSIGVGTTVFPSGMFVKGKFTVAETITDNVFAVADLDATEAALPIRHRREAVWMYARGVIRIIQGWETAYGKLFNSTLGYPAVGNIANNPGGNTGMSLLGYPVWETPSAPVTVTGDDTIVGILVSPKNYIIVDRVGMEVEIVPNMFDATTGFPTGQRGLLAFWRNTAGPVNADAGRQVNIN